MFLSKISSRLQANLRRLIAFQDVQCLSFLLFGLLDKSAFQALFKKPGVSLNKNESRLNLKNDDTKSLLRLETTIQNLSYV